MICRRLPRRLISSSAVPSSISPGSSAALPPPPLNASSGRLIETAHNNVATIPDSSAAIASDTTSNMELATQLISNSAMVLPWWAIIASAGFSLPIIQELVMKCRRNYVFQSRRLMENLGVALRYAELLQNQTKIASSPETQKDYLKVQKDFMQLQLSTNPYLKYLFKQSLPPALGVYMVSKYFDPSSANPLVEQSSALLLDICQNDPTYIVALPMLYFNYLYGKEYDVYKRVFADESKAIFRILFASFSAYFILTPSSIATTIFLSTYGLGLALSNTVTNSSGIARRFGWPVPKKNPFIVNGFYRPLGRWHTLRQAMRCTQ